MPSLRRGLALFWVPALLISGGCHLTRTAAHFASPILEAGTLAFESEADPAFAEAAAPANLKLLEGLLLEAPDNRELLVLASRGYATYAFGFLDPRLDVAQLENPAQVPGLMGRMTGFYQRGYDYGRRALDEEMSAALDENPEVFREVLAKQTIKDVPALFWTAYAMGSLIQLNLTDPDLLSRFEHIQAMMTRVLELDEGYYFGGAHLFFAALYASLPPGGGGDIAGSRRHFEQARALTGGKLLIVDVLEARYLAVREQDLPRFDALLRRVMDTPASVLPEARLANEIARGRASFYLANADAYIIPAEGELPPEVEVTP